MKPGLFHFTLAIVAGKRGFLSIGDWLASYRQELLALLGRGKQGPLCS